MEEFNMKNIILFKTKIASVILLVVSIVLANTLSDRFNLLVFLSLLLVCFAFLMPMFNSSLTLRAKNLQKASGGDIFTDQNE